jgi:hypothetical protein
MSGVVAALRGGDQTTAHLCDELQLTGLCLQVAPLVVVVAVVPVAVAVEVSTRARRVAPRSSLYVTTRYATYDLQDKGADYFRFTGAP